MNEMIDLSSIKPGRDIFSCRIIPIGYEIGSGICVEEAKLFIFDNTAWICHNNSKANGSKSPNRLGYRYSWVVGYPRTRSVQEVKIINKKWNHE
jgi:hypothetical protein